MIKVLMYFFLLMLLGGINTEKHKEAVCVNGRPVEIVPFKDYSYIEVNENVPFEVSLSYEGDSSSVDVSPHSRNVKVDCDNGEARFTIHERGYYMVNINGKRLYIFAEAKRQTPEDGVDIKTFSGIVANGKKNVTSAVQNAIDESALSEYKLVFTPGVYLCDSLTIPTGADIFLEKGAIIKADPDCIYRTPASKMRICRGFITIDNAEDVSIDGDGAIDGGGALIRPKRPSRLILVRGSKNVSLQGVKLQDPALWNTHILGSENVLCRNLKLLCDWTVKNTDGFDPDCSKNVTIDNCFGHCSDDAVAIKSTGHCDLLHNVENITVSNCVFATKKSALKVGTETRAESMSGIRFINNDIIECDRGISLYVADGTSLHDVLYSDNRFEKNYPDTLMMPFHFYARKRKPTSKVGHIYDVTIENTTFETAFPCAPIAECLEGGTIDVNFVNLKINGDIITDEKQLGTIKTTSNIYYK